jgi:SAM-dependent methyltransferase
VRFIELDAEKMGEYFSEKEAGFDVVWISEALSHFPNKALFFRNTHQLLRPGGKLVLADWFKAEGLSEAEFDADVKPIEGLFCPLVLYPIPIPSSAADGLQMACSCRRCARSRATSTWPPRPALAC